MFENILGFLYYYVIFYNITLLAASNLNQLNAMEYFEHIGTNTEQLNCGVLKLSSMVSLVIGDIIYC